MSSQKGNISRNRSQKHKNVRAFKNDLHDTSHITKKINSLELNGLCSRCKEIIDWKVKYKKYKLLTVPKKCVKCLQKKVKDSYHIVCQDCCVSLKICSKCSKSCEELEFIETEAERRRKDDQFKQELKQLSERQRRKFLRLLEKGLLTKENLANEAEKVKKDLDDEDDLEDDLDNEELEDDDDDDEDDDDNADDAKVIREKSKNKLDESKEETNKTSNSNNINNNKNKSENEDEDEDEDEYDSEEDYDEEEDEDEDYEDYEDDDDEDDKDNIKSEQNKTNCKKN